MRIQKKKALKGLVVVTGFGPVAKDLTDVAIRPLFTLIAVVSGVWRGVGHLHLCGTVLSVMEIETVTDVTEQSGGRLLLLNLLFMPVEKMKQLSVKLHIYQCAFIQKKEPRMGLTHHSYPFHLDYFHLEQRLPFSPICL